MSKVAIALSGGVDSAVAAYLLKKRGFEVIGFFLKLKFSHPKLSSWRESEGKASMVASSLGIPLKLLDVRKEFKKEVWDPFWQAYQDGLTPNPCPICNPKIKFGLLFEKAKSLGCTHLATGHYARLAKEKGIWKLLRGKDETKDQSYFLHQVSKTIFPNVIFPLGEMKKTEVKAIAKKVFSDSFSQTPESQELCFIPEEFSCFSRKILKRKKGRVIDFEGKTISFHDGAWFFTKGQRIGIGNIGSSKPLYVASKNVQKNEIEVTKDSNFSALFVKEFEVINPNWINKPKGKTFITKVQVRYRTNLIPCKVETKMNSLKVTLNQKTRSTTPGQFAVFYKGDEVLGGGEIR